MAKTTQHKFGTDISLWLMATKKRIGPCNSRRVWILPGRGLNELAWDNAGKRSREELPNFARELAGEANAEAGDWWKRAQEGEHRTRRAATLVRPAVVLSVHLPSLDLVIG